MLMILYLYKLFQALHQSLDPEYPMMRTFFMELSTNPVPFPDPKNITFIVNWSCIYHFIIHIHYLISTVYFLFFKWQIVSHAWSYPDTSKCHPHWKSQVLIFMSTYHTNSSLYPWITLLLFSVWRIHINLSINLLIASNHFKCTAYIIVIHSYF